MQITIQHRQRDATLPWKKLHYVDCTVLFSEEEKAIIHERGLRGHYIVTDSEVPPPPAKLPLLATLLKVVAPFLFLGGCVAGIGMTIAGNNHGADLTGAICWLSALGAFLASVALKRYARIANQPQQNITLGRLLTNPSFSAYAFDNARAKGLDEEIREALLRLKNGLLVNRDIRQPETFEL